MAETEDSGVMSLTVTLLSAYFANNTVPSTELPALVEGTRRALLGDSPVKQEAPTAPAAEVVAETAPASPAAEVVPEPMLVTPEYKPAVSVEESLASPDQILSLIDGKPYKALKRHLSTHGLTPAQYRARYDLPADYPLVAPSYSAARREVAKKLGLGGKRKTAPAPVAEQAPEAAPASLPVEKAKPVVAKTPPTKSAPARRKPAKAVGAEAKPVTEKPKSKATKTPAAKATAAKAPAAKADAAPKPKRVRARKVAGGATPPAMAASAIEAVAE